MRITILCVLLGVFGCNNPMYLEKGQYLYKGTTVNIQDEANLDLELKNLDSDLAGLSKMKKNKYTLGIYPLRLWFYNIGTQGFDDLNNYSKGRKFLFFNIENMINDLGFAQPGSDFRIMLTTKLGEAPVLFDSILVDETVVRIDNYLFNRGYFEPEISYSVHYKPVNKRAVVDYTVTLNTLNRMRTITYDIADRELRRIVTTNPVASPLASGKRFDVNFLKEERSRIAEHLQSNGYYQFTQDYIGFKVDTSTGIDSFDIYVNITPPQDDSVHWRYKINQVFIYPDAYKDYNTNATLDTILFQDKTRDKKVRTEFSLVESQMYYTPKSIVNNVFIYEKDYYSLKAARQTIGAFANLGIFKYATILPVNAGADSNFRYLDMIIKLEPLKKREAFVELNASTTSDYLLGTYLGFTFAQKNTFKRLDLLRFNVNTGIETEFENGDLFLNTTEFTTDVSLILPRFFWPFEIYTPKTYYPKTITTLQFEYLDRRDLYTGLNTAFRYGSERFEGSRLQQLNIYPIDINFVRVPRRTEEFDSILDANFLLKQSYEEQLIMAPNITYIYNSQFLGQRQFHQYFRGTFELAGTIMFLANALVDTATTLFGPASNPDPKYIIAGLPFSNFARIDLDYRPLLNTFSDTKLAGRINVGISVPYWNSNVNPYVKQFFSGGAYDLRAFQIRKIGPGEYLPYDVTNGVATVKLEDQSADIKITMSAEYRFDIISIIEGAIFCDVGNIWTLKYDEFRPGSQFHVHSFLSQFAVGPGAGLRFDFTYFIFRFDWAYPLYDPGIDGPQGKELKQEGVEFGPKKTTFNFAIGYPF